MDDAKDDSLFLIIYFLSTKSCMPPPKATFKKIENNGSPKMRRGKSRRMSTVILVKSKLQVVVSKSAKDGPLVHIIFL